MPGYPLSIKEAGLKECEGVRSKTLGDRVCQNVPAVRSKTLGDRAFMVAAPRLWNSLPKDLRAITNVNSFKAHIKTYLFKTL